MFKGNKKIVIIECCEQRFSRIYEYWRGDIPRIGERLVFSLFPGQSWDAIVSNILPAKSRGNTYDADAIFLKSDDQELFDVLCDCIDEEGWYEEEDALEQLRS